MARFYANIKGNRGEATRMGTASSGLYGHIRGWHIGASVQMSTDENDNDIVSVRLTGGSSGHLSGKCLGSFKLVNGEFVKV